MQEQFATPLSSAWTWHDPFGDCMHTLHEGMQLHAANGRNLWRANLSTPRLLQPAPPGDFAVQTVCSPVSTEQPTIGGLLLWQDKEHYLLLECGHWGSADIAFRGCLQNEDRFLGRGRLPAERTWLRLERQESRVRALCSADGREWLTAGEIEFPARQDEQVGMHAIGMSDRGAVNHADGMHADLFVLPRGELYLSGTEPFATVCAAQGAHPAPLSLQAQPGSLSRQPPMPK